MAKYIYMTAEQLERYPNTHTELVRGRLVFREPAGARHGQVAFRIAAELALYLREHPIGVAYAAETGFTLARGPDTVRAPDVAFVRTGRVPPPEVEGFAELGPDLVVEVLSPSDRRRTLETKIRHWLSAGTRLVWVISPRKSLASVYRADGSEATLSVDDMLDGEDVLPGFRLSVGALLAR